MFGEGDGSDLAVHDTALGRVGALCCWEHLQPLSKYAMYAQNEQVHVAAWPSFSLYRGARLRARARAEQRGEPALRRRRAVLRARAVRDVVSEEMVEMLCTATTKRRCCSPGGGFTPHLRPRRPPLAEPLARDQEGIVYADIDLGMISLAKAAADPAGHYSRPDVTRLLLNRDPAPRVERLRPGFRVVDEPETEAAGADSVRAAPDRPAIPFTTCAHCESRGCRRSGIRLRSRSDRTVRIMSKRARREMRRRPTPRGPRE